MSGPISLSPVNKTTVIDVESSLSSSEDLSVRSGTARVGSPEQDTGDSRIVTGSWKGGGRSSDLGGFFANADASHLERERTGGSYQTGDLNKAVVDIDPMDMSESMQEAMHRSNLDMSGAEYVRKEIPLIVLSTSSLLKLDSPLMSFTDLQRVLFEEERAAYNQAVLQNMRCSLNAKQTPISCLIVQIPLFDCTHILSPKSIFSLSPAINALQDRLKENEIRLAMLTDEAKTLETEACRGSESSAASPHRSPSHGLRASNLVGHRDLHSSADVRTLAGLGSRSRKGSQ
ncbi:hypothetical protein JRO89_XS09G0130500 [Xanthoceras sorbifolium]|uniref:BRCC36 C-terminal helical domain-containing protein n=1 Tax=Xanthoceras sorbifolium TaxID=99658 RepID=A0ABQ8HLA8_9ROSI|nr:hypothetical protein JRO89_XS09G0130500 [Xanthoceras sorbifolium]